MNLLAVRCKSPLTGLLAACAAMASLPAVAQASEAAQSFSATDAPDPNRWYHVVRLDRGPAADITRRVHARIEKVEGVRSDPQRLDTIVAYGPGHWTYEWEQEAGADLARAHSEETAGNGAAAARHYIEAARLFAIGSSPHLRTDTRAMAALVKARAAYQAAQRHVPGQFRIVKVPFDGKAFEAYLHLPPGKGPFPVVVYSNGSDVVKEQVGDALRGELAMRNIALLSIDMPGIGSGGAYDLTPASDVLHVAAIEHMRRDPAIDPTRVAAMGVSFGGHAAARLFLRPGLGLRGVVEACGPLRSVFMLPPAAYERLPALTLDGVRDRVGLPVGVSTTDRAATMRPFALDAPDPASTVKIDTPLLILGTEADPVAPLKDVGLLVARASKVSTIVSRELGHCPGELLTASTAAAWLALRLRE